MNELTKEKTMTVKELAEALGVSLDTVKNSIRRIMPNKMQNGKTTYLNEVEVAAISSDIANNTDVQKQINNNGKFMSIRNIADVLGISYSAVYRAVEKHFPEKMENGKQTLLNENEVAIISKELKDTYHTAQMTFSAGEKVKNSTTELEVISNALSAFKALQDLYTHKEAEYKATIEAQKEKIALDAPKVEFFDDVCSSLDTIEMKEVAKVLNIHNVGRNKLFEILRNEKILDKNNQPYQSFVDRGYFRIIENRFVLPSGEIKINLKTVVFQKGLDFIRKVLKKAQKRGEKKL